MSELEDLFSKYHGEKILCGNNLQIGLDGLFEDNI